MVSPFWFIPCSLIKDEVTSNEKTEKTIIDIFEPLSGVLSESEIKFVRKIFMVMSRNCPTSSKSMLEELKKKTISELSRNGKK